MNGTKRIHLKFAAFSLQSGNNTDVLYVYDGKDTSAKLLGAFHGSHIPPNEGIYSSSYSMFLIFKSDETVSYEGFCASYHALDYLSKIFFLFAPNIQVTSLDSCRCSFLQDYQSLR